METSSQPTKLQKAKQFLQDIATPICLKETIREEKDGAFVPVEWTLKIFGVPVARLTYDYSG